MAHSANWPLVKVRGGCRGPVGGGRAVRYPRHCWTVVLQRTNMAAQEVIDGPSASRLYVARWALRRGGGFAQAFAPQTALAQQVLNALPAWLLRCVGGLIAWLTLPDVTSREITDGNVNFSFAVRGRGQSHAALFVKQARPFLKWQPQMNLERERMAREASYFRDVAAALGEERLSDRFLPTIYEFDQANSVLVMELLEPHTVMFEQLFATGRVMRAAAESLGEYLALVAARTLSPPGGDAAAAARAAAYWNPTLRAIQLEHVYTVCFEQCETGRGLAQDEQLMAAVATLKAKYLGYGFDAHDRWALCHGDLHPGGVMVDGAHVKIIDPEFAVFGPPGLDVGSLLSGFVLAHLYHALGLAAQPASQQPGRHDESGSVQLLEAVRCLWTCCEAVLGEEGVDAAQVRRIGEDAVGFCCMEVLRTSLGFAGARDPARRIPDEEAVARYQSVAVGLVRHCLLRRQSGGMSVLFEQMEMAEQAAEGWRRAREQRTSKAKTA
jgi:5-methylthioribose kinase